MSDRRSAPADKGYDFRWTYQGSNAQSRVDYWQKDGVKLDYYPTTGTAKTSMDHPSQGKTQMFRRDLSDASYNQVLDNPRHHTGAGYQTRQNMPAKATSSGYGNSYQGGYNGGYNNQGYNNSGYNNQGYDDGGY